MSITTYAGLKTAIGDFLNRDDLTSVAPTFIQLAESQINRDVRHWRMEANTSVTINDEYEDLPNDWVETIRLAITSGDTSALDLISRQAMTDKREGRNNVAGTPRYFTHSAGQLHFFPTPDDTYTARLDYMAKLPALSDSNTSNWLLSEAPDIYLYGSLLQSAPYLVEDNRVAVWAQLYSAAVARLNEASEKARMSGSGLTLKVRGLG